MLASTDDRDVLVFVDRVPANGLGVHRGLIDALLYNGAAYAWRACPLPFIFVGRPTGEFHYNVWSVTIVGPEGPMVSAQLTGRPFTRYGDQTFHPSRVGYQWDRYRDFAGERRVAEEEQAERRRMVEQRSQPRPESRTTSVGFFRGLFFWLFLGGLIWAFVRREDIARWFYSLTPHPATDLVNAAIYCGAPIDRALYDIIAAQEGASQAEMFVRGAQANELTQRLRAHERVLRSESERLIREEEARVARENAFQRAHLELLKAGVSHAEAAARLDEMKRTVR